MSLLGDVGNSLGGNLGLARQVGRLFVPREYKIGSVEIDSFLNVTHAATSQLTQYPVETGGSMTDHIVVAPVTITITGVVSDVTSNEFISFGLVGLGKDLKDKISGKESLTRSQAGWKELRNVQTNRELVTVETGLEVYKNLAIIALGATQDKDTSQAVYFSATLQEVLSVDFDIEANKPTLSVADPVTETSKSNKSTKQKMSDKVNKGNKKPSSFFYKGVI